MKDRLNEILSSINGFYHYQDNVAQQYILLLKEALGLICDLDAKPTSFLDNAKNEALIELNNELTNRMNETFFHAQPDRRKNEFKISRMLIAVVLGNVISNLDPVESDLETVE